MSEAAAKNRRHWDRISDEYQAKHAEQLSDWVEGWGIWNIPESELNVLGDVRDKDVLEFGCGAAQQAIRLARRGARCTGLDNSARQLEHARMLMAEAGVEFPLVHASAEAVPLPDASFDIVFCDHGAMQFADPYKTVPEVARLLRPGGLLAFSHPTPLVDICYDPATEQGGERLVNDYFGLHRFEETSGLVYYQLPYGAWIRLFKQNGLVIEDLIELQAPNDARTTYRGDLADKEWARRWPAEEIWVVRKRA
ncbi:MAG: methyltransferase domain-containing protein [Chloroflexota bacterium]|nr:methyltransferase domain-containing protein [Chloroflexota bacterium]